MLWRPVLSTTWGLLSLIPLAACSSADGAAAASSPPASGSAEPSNDASAPTIAFLEPDLQFLPGEARTITAAVEPAGTYDVHFSLSGDFGDAFLDDSQVRTGDDGMASATLTAPSSARTFMVRAAVGTNNATLAVSAGTGFSDLEVDPHYAGARAVTTWTATVRTGSSCHELSEIPVSDGPLVAEAAKNRHPIVGGVPVGVPLAVTVRAGHFAGGCTDVSGIIAGSTRKVVDVTVVDRPLQMGAVSIDVGLAIDATADTKAAWSGVASDLAANFVNHAASDATALLDAMLDNVPSTPADARDGFKHARETLGWDALLAGSLHDGFGVDGLHGLAGSFIQDAFPKITSAGIVGTLVSRLGAGFASFQLSEFGGLATSADGASALGLSNAIGVTWMAGPGDQVLFGGQPKWPLSRLAAALAVDPARTKFSGATSVPDALSRALSCADVAADLVAGSSTAFGECTADCVKKLCEGGLASMWSRAAYTPEDPTLVDFAATASAVVSDDARPASFQGTWVGSLRIGYTTDKLGGTVTGK